MSNNFVGWPRQRGVALMVMLTLLVLFGLSVFVGQLNAKQYQSAGAQVTAAAIAEAKQALVGDAIAQAAIDNAGYLRMPDLGADEGAEAVLNLPAKDLTVIGKFPWKTLATAPLRDSQKECLWYVVSGRFKDAPKTDAFNWDTAGQLDIVDGSGSVIATNVAALVIAPGPALPGQNRTLANAAYTQCGGNYDAANYLDNATSAIPTMTSLPSNYFSTSTNNSVAPNTGNKTFALTTTNGFNDRLVYITADDIFNTLIRRADFAAAVLNLLGTTSPAFQSHLQNVVISGTKGTDNLDCSQNPDPAFCRNWKEMLFLTELSSPTPIQIDGVMSGSCTRVLLFGGHRLAGQNRGSAAAIADKTNYLENPNASSFVTPLAAAASFAGASTFDWRNPGRDLVRCLP